MVIFIILKVMRTEAVLPEAEPAHLKMELTDFYQQKAINRPTQEMLFLSINLKKHEEHCQ